MATILLHSNPPNGASDSTQNWNSENPLPNARVQFNSWNFAGYSFKNWNTAANGSGTYYDVGDKATVALYAQWKTGYVDQNVPTIDKITLPSGNTYYIADRQIREVVSTLSDAIAGGVSYMVAWDGNSTPVPANIPAGIVVKYNGTNYTGTLAANDAQPGAFYLVASATDTDGSPSDNYDEYVPVGSVGSKTWEKIGDTQIDLADVVTDVSLNKSTDTAIGTDSTFTITQPTIALATDSSSGTGKVQVVTGITSTTASGDNVTAVTGLGTPSTDTFLKGVQVTTQPTITLTANTSSSTGRITYLQSQGTAATTKVSATTSDNDNDTVAAIVGLGTPTTQTAVKSVSATTKKLSTGTVYGVQSSTTSVTGVQASTTTASKSTNASITYSTGSGTTSTTNTDWLKGISVSNGVLSIGAATPDIATENFTDVTVPIKNSSATTVPIKNSSATTYATGSLETGTQLVSTVDIGETFNAVTGYSNPTTDNVLGSDTTFATTLSTGTSGDITVATGINAGTTRYLSATASGTAVGANGTGNAITEITPSTDIVLGTGSTITVTPTKSYIKATASGANTAWNNKDSITVVKDAGTDLTVTHGS